MSRDLLTQAGVYAAIAKLAEADSCLRGLLAPLAEDSLAAVGAERPIIQYVQQRTLEELRQQGLKTNDIVEIMPFGPAEGFVVINGSLVQLRTVEALLVQALVEHGLAARKSQPDQSSFLAVPDIIISIDRMRERARISAGSNLTKTEIYKAVDSLREKLSAEHLNPNLVEGRRGQGYRLSTPWWNLIIHGLSPLPQPTWFQSGDAASNLAR